MAADEWREVLAQPTRTRLFALLERLGRPAGTEELAAELGLHPSGVRLHLERLHGAGLVVRERAAQRRGRPRASWRIAPGALGRLEPPGAYRQLACWLARCLPSGPERLAEVERAGRELGRELVGPGDPAPGAAKVTEPAGAGRVADVISGVMAELGFAPALVHGRDGRLSVTLGRCPYRDAARANQPAVCALHRGLTAGLLQRVDPSAQLTEFAPRDPERAGCVIRVQTSPAAGG